MVDTPNHGVNQPNLSEPLCVEPQPDKPPWPVLG